MKPYFSIRKTLLGAALLAAVITVGCGSQRPTPAELAAFQQAGPVRPEVDFSKIVMAQKPNGSYQVVVGDVLELQMPVVLQKAEPEWTNETASYFCRVEADGSICPPIIGPVGVADKTLDQIESMLVQAYYPKYTTARPTIVARVGEYRTVGVSIVGSVNEPGTYQLRNDEMSLVTLLMKAGGIERDGAGLVRIRHSSDADDVRPVVLPVKGLNIPFTDVALAAGDTVEVARYDQQVFTVIGLVNRPGVFPYPVNVRMNVAQALAMALGPNPVADPKWARIYRQDPEGNMLSVAVNINSSSLMEAARMAIKPGDVIAVEHTSATRTRMVLAEILYLGLGANLNVTYRAKD